MNPYTGLLLLMFVVAGFLVTMLVLASFLGPRRRTPTKDMPFECGSIPVGAVRATRFDVQFYLVAVVFILFDVEIIFMYPWALVLTQLGWSGFFAMFSFIVVLAAGLVYIWRKGVLDWASPAAEPPAS